MPALRRWSRGPPRTELPNAMPPPPPLEQAIGREALEVYEAAP
jgi:hypothetical protein